MNQKCLKLQKGSGMREERIDCDSEITIVHVIFLSVLQNKTYLYIIMSGMDPGGCTKSIAQSRRTEDRRT